MGLNSIQKPSERVGSFFPLVIYFSLLTRVLSLGNKLYYSSTNMHPHRARNYHSSGTGSQSYSPTKYGVSSSSSSVYESQPQQHYYAQSPPMKPQNFHRGMYGTTDYYTNNNASSSQFYHPDGTTYYHSSSSTSSSQDGYYGDDLEDSEDYRLTFGMSTDSDPEMTTIPTVPTPIGLSLYEHGKKPSGRVLITTGNQTIEFFSGVVNAPQCTGAYTTE